MTWAQLSAIFEPTNHQRRIIGFDTFEGIKELSESDGQMPKPDFRIDSEAEIRRCIALYDMNRFVGHVPKVELVRGDACETIPEYVDKNKHLVVSLLYLDFDIYEPTKTAILNFMGHMQPGSIIAFDELNNPNWPGETRALKDVNREIIGFDAKAIKWQRFSFGSTICYGVL